MTSWSQFLPSTLLVPGTELRSSNLAASLFTHSAILHAHCFFFFFLMTATGGYGVEARNCKMLGEHFILRAHPSLSISRKVPEAG